MHRFRLVALVAVLLATSALAQSRQPLTHETLWLMKRVSSPVPSPDGKWVIYKEVADWLARWL